MSDNYKGIYYSVTGKRSKPAVMFLHGFMGDSRDWSEIIDRLKEDVFCITIDLPGHGQSNNPDSLKNLRDIEAFTPTINGILMFFFTFSIRLHSTALAAPLPASR